jgi:hypothetical protein
MLGLPTLGRFLSLVRVILGSIFLVSGVAKIPMLSPVAATIRQIAPLGSVTSFVCAASLIGFELGVAAFMLLRVHLVCAARVGTIVTAGFVAILGRSILRGDELRCNCFGVLGVFTSNQLELALDLFLLGGFILVAWKTGSGRKQASTVAWKMVASAAVTVVVVATGAELAGAYQGDQRTYGTILQRAESQGLTSRRSGQGNRLLLFVDVRELQCAICYEDFVALCDSLSSPGKDSLFGRTVVVVRDGAIGEGRSGAAMMRWARETGIAGPILFLSEEEYDLAGSGKNFALVVDRSGGVVHEEDMPMGEELRKVLLTALDGQ